MEMVETIILEIIQETIVEDTNQMEITTLIKILIIQEIMEQMETIMEELLINIYIMEEY